MTGFSLAALEAMGDQVQAACAASGLDVIGFTVLVKSPDGATAETRARIERSEYAKALAAYVEAERADPRRDERPS